MNSSLAKATFEAFKPWVNVWDCGVRGDDSPIHMIPKKMWELRDRYRNGESPFFRTRNGSQLFDPQRHIGMRRLSPYHIDQHLNGTKHYFTSNQHGKALLMIDVDWHKKWQKTRCDEQQKVIEILTSLFPNGFHVPSERGHHVFIKTLYYTVAEINGLISRFQTALKDMLLSFGILLDIEVKGSVTAEKSGTLAQLPCRANWWSSEALDEFRNCESLNSLQLENRIRKIESFRNSKTAAKTKLLLKKINDQWSEQEAFLGDLAHYDISDFHDEKVIQNSTCVREKPVFPEPTDCHTTFSYPVLDWHPEEPDAFERTRKVLLPFFRSFFREHRREPCVKEGISYLRQNGLYSGTWGEGESERSRRVSNVLKFISESFDPKKLRTSTECMVNHGLIQWVRKHYSNGIKGSLQDKRVLDFLGQTCGENKFHVPMEFIIHFFQLLNLWQQNPDDNNGLATSFFKENWNRFDSTTYSAPAWNQDYYRVTREHFNSTGIVNIYDREHKAGKCWRWKKGGNYPQKYRTKKVRNITGNGRWRYLKQNRTTTVQYLYGIEWIKSPFQSKTTFCEMISGRSPP